MSLPSYITPSELTWKFGKILIIQKKILTDNWVRLKNVAQIVSERITKVFISTREHAKGSELKSEHRRQRQIEGEPSGWGTGEFLDDYVQFWLQFPHLLVWEGLRENQQLVIAQKIKPWDGSQQHKVLIMST